MWPAVHACVHMWCVALCLDLTWLSTSSIFQVVVGHAFGLSADCPFRDGLLCYLCGCNSLSGFGDREHAGQHCFRHSFSGDALVPACVYLNYRVSLKHTFSVDAETFQWLASENICRGPLRVLSRLFVTEYCKGCSWRLPLRCMCCVTLPRNPRLVSPSHPGAQKRPIHQKAQA